MDGPLLYAVTPYGRGGGSSRVRVFDWLDHLGWDAVRYDYAGLPTNAPQVLGRHPLRAARGEIRLRQLRRHVKGHHVLLSRQASPFSQGTVEAGLLSNAGFGVFDFDDSFAHAPSRGGVRGLFPPWRVWERAVASADLVIAGNEFLADQASSFRRGGKIIVIPSCVEPARYRIKRDYHVGAVPRAVWLGSPTTEQHLRLVTAPLLELHRSHGLRLTLISSGRADLGPLARMTERVEWSPDAAQSLADADVGLMPLPDSPSARGKCAYKLLQYGVAGLPAVASPVGANRKALDHGVGLEAGPAEQWREQLTTLIEAPTAVRAEVGARSRSAVVAFYSFGAWEDTWKAEVGAGVVR